MRRNQCEPGDPERLTQCEPETALYCSSGRSLLQAATNTRFNFDSGKGAIDADISYPIDRLIGGNLNFYLIGQAFTGYGENLLDYNRRMTRLRVGLAIVR